MGASVAEVVVKITSDAEELKRDLEKVDDLSGRAALSIDNMAGAAAALGASAVTAATAVFGLAQSTADTINNLTDMSARTGVAVKTLKGLELAARGAGADVSELEGIFRKATAQGLEFEEVAAQIQAIEDPTERAAKAMELLGEEGGRLIQVLGDTSISRFAEFAERFGSDTGPEAAKAASDWQRNLATLQTVLEGILDPAGGLPALNSLVEDLTIGTVFVKEFAEAFTDVSVSVDEAFSIAVERTREFHAALGDLNSTTRVSISEWEEFRLRQELGLEDTPAIEFKQAVDDVKKATEEAAEAARKWLDELNKSVVFKQGAEDIREMVTVIDPLTGGLRTIAEESREIATTFEDFVPVMGTSFEAMGRFTGKATEGISEANAELVDMLKTAKRLEAFDKLGEGMAVAGDLAGSAFSAAGDLIEAFGKDSEKVAKRLFAVNKAAALVDIALKTGVAIMTNLALGPVGIPLAVAAGVVGAVQFAAAAAQQFEGATPPSAGGGGGAGAQQAQGAQAAIGGGGPVSKGPDIDTSGIMTRLASRSSQPTYRHRDMDVVANDGRLYVGGAFDTLSSGNGQSRFD